MTPFAPIFPFHAPSPLITCCNSEVQPSPVNPGSAIRASSGHDGIGPFCFSPVTVPFRDGHLTSNIFFALPRLGSEPLLTVYTSPSPLSLYRMCSLQYLPFVDSSICGMPRGATVPLTRSPDLHMHMHACNNVMRRVFGDHQYNTCPSDALQTGVPYHCFIPFVHQPSRNGKCDFCPRAARI